MTNFLRAISLVRRNRITLASVVATALFAGILWGVNIGAAYPFVEVIFRDQSLRTWVDEEIRKSTKASEKLQSSIAQLEQQRNQTAPDRQSAIQQEMLQLQTQWEAEQEALARCQWAAPFIHQYAPTDAFLTLVLIVVALLIGTIVKDIALAANFNLASRLSELILLNVRRQLFQQTLRWDLSYFGDQHGSRLLSHFTNDIAKLKMGLQSVFGPALVEPFKMMACLIGACLISWRLLVLSLLITPPALFLMRCLSRSIKRASHRLMEQMAEVFRVLNETTSGIQTVKAFTMETFETDRFRAALEARFRTAIRMAFYSSLTRPVSELLGVGVVSLALLAGAYIVLKEKTHVLGIAICDRPLSLGSLFLFYGMLAGVSGPARKLAGLVVSIQTALAAADRIYNVMDREPRIVNPTNPQPFPQPLSRITFDGADFEYVADDRVLQDINLEIGAGETVAIVGPNGCGKSTLANMIPRFHDPTKGTVRFGDVDIRHLRLDELRSRIGVVTQQTYLFDDTVLNNIRYGTLQASYEEVVDAAKKAKSHGFIVDKLPQAYDTLIGQGGSRLSGGQRQRIALARAILRDPEILILDEATSQIDIASEQAIHQALEEFARGRTVIIITHRLSTLQLADRIVVMDAGRIVDVGTDGELHSRCTTYRSLHDIHFRRSA